MEVQDLREFIAEKFELHDRILGEKFRGIDMQFEVSRAYQKDNVDSHLELKDSIKQLQEDLTKVKAMEAFAKQRHEAKQELEKYKEDLQSKYSLVKMIETYPKIILTALAVLLGVVLTGDIAGMLKFLGL